MDNYIVRIYRRDENDPGKVIGLVESVETGEVKSFEGMEELGAALRKKRKDVKRCDKVRK